MGWVTKRQMSGLKNNLYTMMGITNGGKNGSRK